MEIIKQKIKNLISLGYSQEEILNMIKSLPALLGYSIENIKQKIEDLMSLGYSKEEVINMTKTLPALFSLNIENIKNKIYFYREIGLDFIITEKTKNLMQSVELSYARYNYLQNNNLEMRGYSFLFQGEKKFKKQFGVSNQELLLMYP